MATRKHGRTRRKPRAKTEDVLGDLPAKERIRPKWRNQYERLLQLQEQYLRSQSDLARDAVTQLPTFSTHMADAGTDEYDRDFALSMLSSEQDVLYEIEQALDRIRKGTYGTCEATGKPIEPARLEAVPWTRFTAAAEKQLEKQGALKHPRLGERDTLPRTEATEEDLDEAV